jgi:hypothetical protein
MAHRIFAVGCLFAVTVLCVPLASGKGPQRDRRAFAQAMNKIEEGMSESEVLARVGAPDDVTTQKDWRFSFADVREIWRYGVAGHMQVATLGQVFLTEEHRVKWVFGQGAPPPAGMFTEAELKRLFEVFYDLGERDRQYNPRMVIRAVNMLQPFGKEKALDAVTEFVRVTGEGQEDEISECLIIVLRTLFEVPTVPTVFDDAQRFLDGEVSRPKAVAPLSRFDRRGYPVSCSDRGRWKHGTGPTATLACRLFSKIWHAASQTPGADQQSDCSRARIHQFEPLVLSREGAKFSRRAAPGGNRSAKSGAAAARHGPSIRARRVRGVSHTIRELSPREPENVRSSEQGSHGASDEVSRPLGSGRFSIHAARRHA